ncbi:aminopeptidase P family protein [Pontixanthobacter aestiaquae]|uniref:M24 family metallopeptidase n=1 Tax=Pontixanthobacter aestiaquae TaxID=1509367 RepID=A0A844Z8V0_9SPHN|nr:aminopeptidase P family protein [Pontixanthobacter aestiaquae]MDN3646688.1 aminopeptidase P family protein [Pontixanthobacter aestiaquae]MXO82329.1 M24 family metallopeptidase [Pontixanthobacter aestiaquae]
MLMQTHEARLSALREELKRRELDGFIVPISDEHMSEYVGSYAQRIGWLTGFGGSAGSAIVLQHKAAMFVDGRYTIQVRDQVDGNLYEYQSTLETDHAKWLIANCEQGMRIGYDAWLHSRGWASALLAALGKKGVELVATDGNPIDAVWDDQPAPSPEPATVHPEEFAGKSSAEKRAEIADWLKAEELDSAVISALDSVAWLLNIRGADVDRTPVALSYLIAHSDGTAELFIAPEKVTPELEQHLGNAVTIRDRAEFTSGLKNMAGKTVAVDPDFGVAAIYQALEEGGATTVAMRDPAIMPKAIKNSVEQQGHRDAQARDGAAVTKFLHWLSHAPSKGGQTELSAVAKLREFRDETGVLKDQSFDTISASGPNGALCHYRVDEDSNRDIEPGSVFLCDSGGQYLDGTTDITRTVWIAGDGENAEPNAEVRDRYTRVLKGHIQIARVIFPQGTNGGQLDALARQYLWEAGVDYAHGTGHGVGSFLAVHEGPQRIAKPSGGQPGTSQELFAGMILSNEPGYYKAGEFGIRIENLVLVKEQEIDGMEGIYLGFENLTWVPMARNMLDMSLLTTEEKQWWNDYHATTREILAPQLEGDVLAWLEDACKPI